MDETQLDLPRLRAAGVNLQVFAVFVDPRRSDAADPWAESLGIIECLEDQEARYPDMMRIARDPGDIDRITSAGRLAAVLSLEGAYALDGDPARLETLRSRGVRILGLTWNDHTGWADGCDNRSPLAAVGGLSSFGREVVRELERLRILPDVAHAAPETVDAVLETATGPVVDTHTCARALCGHPRNLDDRHIEGIAASGGVIGVCFSPTFLRSDGAAGLTDLADHIDHVLQIAGQDHVGLGSDFDGLLVPLPGLEDVSRLPRLTVELLRRGYPEPTVAAILGGNWIRLCRETAGL